MAWNARFENVFGNSERFYITTRQEAAEDTHTQTTVGKGKTFFFFF